MWQCPAGGVESLQCSSCINRCQSARATDSYNAGAIMIGMQDLLGSRTGASRRQPRAWVRPQVVREIGGHTLTCSCFLRRASTSRIDKTQGCAGMQPGREVASAVAVLFTCSMATPDTSTAPKAQRFEGTEYTDSHGEYGINESIPPDEQR